jgi:tetratricopeptide (TPR) repeat protein
MTVSLRMIAALGVLWLLGGSAPAEANETIPATPAAIPASLDDSASAPAGISTRGATESMASASLRRRILRVWSLPAASLEERVDRTLRAGYQRGMRDLEAPARALLLSPEFGAPLERAKAAARLAPSLPAARAALASALWDEGEWRPAAIELSAAVRAVPNHLEASLWARVTVWQIALFTVVGGALLFLSLATAMAIPSWVRNLSAIREDLPSSSRFAMIASLLLLPAVVGEGPAGVVAAMVLVAAACGTIWRRAIVAVSAAAFVVALYPVLDASTEAEAALGSDPVALAAHSAEHGFPSADELARVEWASQQDALAGRAMALRAKRTGDLDLAAQRYAQLLEGDERPTPDLLNNTAGVALAQGRIDEAIDHYERAAERADSPLLLFNLSQAYGKAIRLDAQDLALAQAQAIDASETALLTGDFGATAMGLVADIPLPAAVTTARLQATDGGAGHAARARSRIAPGWIGRGLMSALLVFGAAFALGAGLGFGLSRIVGEENDAYSDIARILKSRGGDPAARMARIAQVRDRQARVARLERVASLLIPGAAGVLSRRPLLGLLGATVAAAIAALFLRGPGSVPDPLAIGGLAAAITWLASIALGIVYLSMLGVTLAIKERH